MCAGRWSVVVILLTAGCALPADNQVVGRKDSISGGGPTSDPSLHPPATVRTKVTCRDRNGLWEPEDFRWLTCATCYNYLFFGQRGAFRAYGGYLYAFNNTQPPLLADAANQTTREAVCESISADGCFRWTDCCNQAAACCEHQQRAPAPLTLKYGTVAPGGVSGEGRKGNVSVVASADASITTCPRTWDGYACWGDTPASTTVYVGCPAFLPHVIPGVDAYKTCLSNGTWYRDPKTGLEWSNFTACLSVDNIKANIFVNIACNSISLTLLVPSTAVFLIYRQLRVQHRIRLHINLFMSFIFTNLVFILWDVLVVYDRLVSATTESRMHQNSAGCKILYILTRYTRCSNFLWMLSEAYYLHRLIARAFEPPKSLLPFYLLAWGFPWIPVSVYSIIRAFHADSSCWVQNFGPFEWLIYTPNLLSLAMNVVFLLNILRILLTQLQAHPNEPSNYRRALKATFVLIPLFGIQLLFIIYRPPHSVSGAKEYAVFESIVTHSQGFFVALVFCFLNGEVLSHVKSSMGPLCRTGAGGAWDTKHSMSVTTQVTQADQPNSSRSTTNATYIPMKPIQERVNNGEAKQ